MADGSKKPDKETRAGSQKKPKTFFFADSASSASSVKAKSASQYGFDSYDGKADAPSEGELGATYSDGRESEMSGHSKRSSNSEDAGRESKYPKDPEEERKRMYAAYIESKGNEEDTKATDSDADGDESS